MTKILSNQATCLKCGDTIFSAHRHDFVSCSCETICVDGGMDYIRRVGDMLNVDEQSIEWEDALYNTVLFALQEAEERGCNNLGVICTIARYLRDNGFEIKDTKDKTPEKEEDILTKPSINWDEVSSEFNYLATDEDGESYLYKDKPNPSPVSWNTSWVDPCVNVSSFSSFTKGTCDCKDSLISRGDV